VNNSVGRRAFAYCTTLASVTIGNSVTNIATEAFLYCIKLVTVTIGNSVTDIGTNAFLDCYSLTSVAIPDSVTRIESSAFYSCVSLTSDYFNGNAPSLGSDVFAGDSKTTLYYLPGTTGWGTTLGGRPTAPWMLSNPVILNNSPSFGLQTNGFGFMISWATNIPVVVEACKNPANSAWYPLATNTLSGGSSYFSDPQWTNYPARFYRLRSP
jgi:hypothetical protein